MRPVVPGDRLPQLLRRCVSTGRNIIKIDDAPSQAISRSFQNGCVCNSPATTFSPRLPGARAFSFAQIIQNQSSATDQSTATLTGWIASRRRVVQRLLTMTTANRPAEAGHNRSVARIEESAFERLVQFETCRMGNGSPPRLHAQWFRQAAYSHATITRLRPDCFA